MNYELKYFLFAIFILISRRHISANNETTKINTEEAENLFFHTKIINPHNFNYILNPGEHVCGKNKGNDLFLLAYVHTSPGNFKRRLAIRETWSQQRISKQVRLLFIMGYNPNKTAINLYENSLYGDILQEDFYDSYRNLTYKGIMAMKWITEYCPNVKFILKVDDDIVVNTFLLLKHLRKVDKYQFNNNNRTIMCRVWDKMQVMRNNKSKWFVSLNEYKSNEYGKYCSGSAFIFTANLAPLLYNMSHYVGFFWVDDYYITGLVPRFLKVTYKTINSFYALFEKSNVDAFKNRKYKIFGHIPGKIDLMYQSWSYINDHNQTFKEFKVFKEFNWV